MIKPKYTLQSFQTPASRQFTDRENFVTSFERMIQNKRQDQHSVLVYYGVGGIGKSSLIKKLCHIADQHQEKLMWAMLDFEMSTYREPETAIFHYRKELKNKYGVKFTFFDIAYTIYWKKAHPDKRIDKDNFVLFNDDSSSIMDILTLISEVPVMGIIPKIMNLTLKGTNAINHFIAKNQNELYQLEHLASNEILNRLPMYFALDLRHFLDSNPIKPILFIDTYEALWEGNRTESRLYTIDEWVRELIAQLPEVLWVICGREKIKWGELNSDWNDVLDQHLLGKLSVQDAKSFLKSCGIHEEDIQNVIVQSSKGLPYYLDLSVDTYEVIKYSKNREPKLEDFATNYREIFDRFIKYLDTNEIETLKVLSTPRFWTIEIFEKLVKTFNTGYPSTAHDLLKQYSFIYYLHTDDVWDMHQLIRESFQHYQSTELKQSVHTFMFEYYNRMIEDVEVKYVGEEHKTAIKEAYYHSKFIYSDKELLEWFEKVSKVFVVSEKYDTIIPIFEDLIHNLIQRNVNVDPLILSRNISELARMYNLAWRYNSAQSILEKGVSLLEATPFEQHPVMGDLSRELAIVYYGRHCELEKAENLLKNALKISEKGDDPKKISSNLDELARLYRIMDRDSEAITLFQQSLKIRQNYFGENSLAVALAFNALGYTYHKMNSLQEAEEHYIQSLSIKKEIVGEYHRMYARTLNNLGRCYFDKGELEKAEEIYHKAKELKEIACGLEHPTLAAVYHDFGKLYYVKGDYQEAKHQLEKAIHLRERYLGKIHPGVGEVLVSYGLLLLDMKEYILAEDVLKESIKIYKQAPGLTVESVVEAYEGLISLFRILNNKEALNKYENELNNLQKNGKQ